ncbi:hypothetical protein [Streptomyces sp. NPDC048606]|uniref:hypothetical protein n=1 Tax=Streptomyces sp. NPDC048606 TaxID=3154726 RepID=UPI003449EC34
MSATLLGTLARTTAPRTALRRFLALDSVVTTANGLAYAVLPAPLGRLLGVDPGLLATLGVVLVAYGAGVGFLASRRRPPAPAVRLVIETNYVWAALSLVSLFVWFDATTAGAVWIPAQGLTVAGFALLQQLALRSVTE